jgi:hypothetical protein
MDYSQLVIVSEIALSLYPQLIKLIPTTLDIQLVVRFITYSILALSSLPIFETLKALKTIPITSSIIMGLVNILHIASSYYSFKTLSSGFSYSLFYTYPIFNLLGRSIFNNEKITPINYLYIAIAIVGVYLVYYKQSHRNISTSENTEDTEKNDNQKEKGLIAGICSAITESLIYFMVKNDIPTISPFIQIIKTYLLGGILSIGYISYISYKTIQPPETSSELITDTKLDWNAWITIILFNALIGFVGYVLRFYLIPKISTLTFNSLIFTGVIFAYIWGYILGGEPIYLENILGSGLILGSIYMINKN